MSGLCFSAVSYADQNKGKWSMRLISEHRFSLLQLEEILSLSQNLGNLKKLLDAISYTADSSVPQVKT